MGSKNRKHKNNKHDNIEVSDISVETQKRFEVFAIAALLVFAIYQSILLFGYTSVPNSDFPLFVKVAEKMLSFEIPNNFKRLPGLGLLQIGLSKVIGGNHPVLTAGWLLNAIVHPLSVVLLYLIARRIIGKAAFWLAIVFAINPQVAFMLTQPMAETTLMFFTLLTLYLIIIRSKYCYVIACAATVIRYDAAVLILAAMTADVFERRDKKYIIITLAKGALAFLPLILWFVVRKLNVENSSRVAYVGHYTSQKHIGLGYLDLLWKTAIGNLIQLPAWIKATFVQRPTPAALESLKQANEFLFGISKLLAIAGLATATVYAVIKKNLKLVPWFVFLACNLAVHMMRMKSKPRYCYILVPIVILLCCYGWQLMLKGLKKIPTALSAILCTAVVVISLVWTSRFVPALDGAANLSPVSSSLLAASIAAIIVFAIATLLFNKGKGALGIVTMTAFMALVVFSNHFNLAKVVGSGKTDAEFRMLGEWFTDNTEPGEKVVTSLPDVVKLFAPSRKKDIVHISHVGGNNRDEFVNSCYKKGVKYVAWDSRIGLLPKYTYYKRWKIDRIDFMKNPRDIGPYQFVTQLKQSNRRYIHIFRLKERTK
jgi:hypothetical protein